MTVAWHISPFEEPSRPAPLAERLNAIYAWAGIEETDFSPLLTGGLERIYVGDEFCLSRLPSPRKLEQLMAWCRTEGLSLTLLTPALSDRGMDHCLPLLDALADWDPSAEVVVNDWGMSLLLNERYPSFQLGLGRLLNKMFKDPRVKKEWLDSEGGHPSDLFNSCTFDFAVFRRKAADLGVTRLEKDLGPFGSPSFERKPLLEESWSFPFGYVTSGRICWSAALCNPPERKFAIDDICPGPCRTFTIRLKSSRIDFPLLQAGNTVYYLYPPDTCASLIQTAGRLGYRLVFDDSVFRAT